MSVMTLLNLAILAVLALWTVDTYLVQPWRYRRAASLAGTTDTSKANEATQLLLDSPLSTIMGKALVGVLICYLLGVIVLRLDVDFSLALVLATGATGLFWLLDLAYLHRLRQHATQAVDAWLKNNGVAHNLNEPQPLLVEYAVSFFPVLLAVLVLRSFLVEPFTIPSGSMLPTLDIGDYILVNKYDYGLRLPVLGTRLVNIGEPQHGDVIVFHFPLNPSQNFIKRLVGLPGDHVVVDGEKVYINGKLLPETFDSQDPEVNPWQIYYREQLGTHSHIIRQMVGREDNTPDMKYTDVVVPPGQYFMMGDNRNDSEDSRYWGFVPDRNIVGKAVYVWIHKKPGMNLPTFSHNGKVD